MNNLRCLFNAGIGSTTNSICSPKSQSNQLTTFFKLASFNHRPQNQRTSSASIQTRDSSSSVLSKSTKQIQVRNRPHSSTASIRKAYGSFNLIKSTNSVCFGSKFSSQFSSRSSSKSICKSSQFDYYIAKPVYYSSMAPIIVNIESYVDKLIADNRVLIFSQTTCPFCLKVRCSRQI